MNLYSYTGNDPVNMVDPSGTSTSSPCGDRSDCSRFAWDGVDGILKGIYGKAPEINGGLSSSQVNNMGPSDVVKYWASGKGGNLYFGPDSKVSKDFKDGKGAQSFLNFFNAKFGNNPKNYDRVDNYAYVFTWGRALKTANTAEQIVGSWGPGSAMAFGNPITFEANNRMGANSLLFGRQLGEMGISPVGQTASDLIMTIEWDVPLKGSE